MILRGRRLFVALVTASCCVMCAGRPASQPGAAPTAKSSSVPVVSPEVLMALARQVTDAWITGDPATVDRLLSDRFVDFKEGVRLTKRDLVSMVGAYRCSMRNWSLDDGHMVSVNARVQVLSYRGAFDGECTASDGATVRMLTPTRAASIFLLEGRQWRGAFHSENLVVGSGVWRGESAGQSGAAAELSGAASGSPVASSPATDVLVRLHTSVIDAVAAQDAPALAALVTPSVSGVGPSGEWWSGRAALVSAWPDTIRCADRAPARSSGGVAQTLAPGVELLTIKSAACGDRADGHRFQSAIYVWERRTWRLGFVFDSATRR